MAPLSFKKAKELGLLNEKEIERILTVHLAMAEEIKPSAQAMQLAAAEAGNPERSYRTMYSATMKKLKDKECFIDVLGVAASVSVPTTPKATPKKRKSKDDATTPAPKKVARGKEAEEAVATKVEDADAEV